MCDGQEETEEAIADSRAGRVSGRFATVAELLADLNADDTPNIQQGSANVYADLGYPDAGEMLVKTRLVTKIGEAIKAQQLSTEQAATLLGLTPSSLHELLTGRFRSQSVNDLERLASRLDEASR
ncbi:helix-turn-helix domain-containing protein [Xanthomonas citri]|uniref:helix-turn-helix domain-containing protein n=1 Tax=Xanthomonas citri TaxID=346 RepID=UPI001CBBDDB4|nr:XRE family transcriptional regulator [Xanthomonas citri]MBZ3927911.1 Fis family transcriptional regulator [Xanthomonas citri pv. thirumalacharii]